MPKGTTLSAPYRHNGLEGSQSAVIVAAANPWWIDRMADHQLALALSEYSPVIYVDPCTSVLSRLRDSGLSAVSSFGKAEWVTERVLRIEPEGLPGLSRRTTARINRHLIAWQVNRLLRQNGWHASAVLEANLLSPIIDLIDAKKRVYWAQDDFVSMASLIGVEPGIFMDSEVRVERAADTVVAANEIVAEKVARNCSNVHLIPFGCNTDLFAMSSVVDPASDISIPRPRALLMGSINDRIDIELLEAVADRGISLLIVGPKSREFVSPAFDRLAARENVQWVGGRSFQDLPGYLASADLGLVPYTHSAFNEGSFPLKTLEYLAGGLAVVASDLPAIRWLESDEITIADDPAAFASAVSLGLGQPTSSEAIKRRRTFAAEHDWTVRAEEFARVLGI